MKAKEHPQPAILMALAEQEQEETPACPAYSGGTWQQQGVSPWKDRHVVLILYKNSYF